MSKGKSKKKGLSEKVRAKKKDTVVKVNPFEVKVNRQKHDVLNRKLAKHDKGLPGVSRSKAIKKREATLLVEYEQRGKSNKMVDKRFGENDAEMDPEEKMLQRFTKERQRGYEKSEAFNLTETEDLTHYGQSLSEIEKFEKPPLSDDDDDDDQGKISAKVVSAEHFGGFLNKKSVEGEGQDGGKAPTWKERMEEIIRNSKKEKFERQHEREMALEMTEKLDEQWKQMRGLVSASGEQAARAPKTRAEADEYDVMVRELKYEIKGQAVDRLKTEEELAREEAERLTKLEDDRQARMHGHLPSEEKNETHRSADDLDDGPGWVVAGRGRQAQFQVAYKDGKMVQGAEEEEQSGGEQGAESDDQEYVESGEENGADSGGEDEDDSDGAEDKEDDDGSDSDSGEDGGMEQTSDVESDQEDEGDEDKEAQEAEAAQEADTTGEAEKITDKLTNKASEAFKKELVARGAAMRAARAELAYTFTMPESEAGLAALLQRHSAADQLTILERLRACHHPSLKEGNKEKLASLFPMLWRYYSCACADGEPEQLWLCSQLLPHLYQLAQVAPLTAGQAVIEWLKEQQEQLQSVMASHGGRGVWPGLGVLAPLKAAALLYPTSDFHHHVTTPAALYMSQLLTACPITTRRDISAGLFVCTLFLEFVMYSKRVVPEAINFLAGLLFLASKKEPGRIEPVIHPFKPIGRNIDFLELRKCAKGAEVAAVKLSNVFCKRHALYLGTDAFRLGCIHQALMLLQRYHSLYQNTPACRELFHLSAYFLGKLPVSEYPAAVRERHAALSAALTSPPRVRPWLTMNKQQTPTLQLFEPKFDETFDGRKRGAGNRAQNEQQRLKYKLKKETKGAMREIRKDSHFIHTKKLEDQIGRDAERKRKVKALYADLANQEGDFKALKRKKEKDV